MESSHRDIREQIFRDHLHRRISAAVKAEAAGVVSGVARAAKIAEDLGLTFSSALEDGDNLHDGSQVVEITGDPYSIARAEDVIIGTLSKSSGIATVARQTREKAGSHFRVVSGGFKKMPSEIKQLVRQAAQDGDIGIRISDEPFVYLDKNYVRMLGGIRMTLEAVAHLDRSPAIQIRGETGRIEEEAVEAVESGAAIVMVDTGRLDHLATVSRILTERGLRSRVQLAFAGNVSLDDLDRLVHEDVDIVDMGYAILDAPCLPMTFDVCDPV
jgi:nicotinate-nucleotide pyrophosphorylase (carboxylating)